MGDSYGGRGTTNATEEKEKHRRKGTAVVWSSDSTKFAMVRSDMRKVADLWVVHAVGNDRCAAQRSTPHTPPFRCFCLAAGRQLRCMMNTLCWRVL